MADSSEALEPILTERQRRNPIALPADPGDEELAQDWTLSEADKAEALRCRGDELRRSFAIQLCVLRKYGRFLPDYESIPARILSHVSGQLGLEPSLFLSMPGRDVTQREHQQRIREYLGWRPFDPAAEEQAERWVYGRALEGAAPQEVLRRLEDLLRSWKVVLPAPSTLERMVGSFNAQAQEGIFRRIAGALGAELERAIDELLTVSDSDRKSALFHLKAPPPEPSAEAIALSIERWRGLSALAAVRSALRDVSPELVGRLSDMTRRYDAQALRRFAPAKRHAMVACFLAEAHRTLLDHVVDMHDQFLIGMCRRSRHAFEARHRDFRRRSREGLATLLGAMEALLDPERTRQITLDELFLELDEAALRSAWETCREYKRLEERGYIDQLVARYGVLCRYWPAFLGLPFEGQAGSEPILHGVVLARKLHARELRELPDDAPLQFIPSAWRKALEREDGTPDRKLWELALALAVRDALRSGDVYLAESRHHAAFWNLVYDADRWEQERRKAYAVLSLPSEADKMPARLCREFEDAARAADRGLPTNSFARIEQGRFRLRRPDALEVSDQARKLGQVIETHLPRVRIEDLLVAVDQRCRFTAEFRPPSGYQPRSENLYPALLAALVAHGTNLGIAAMGHSAEGISVDTLQHATKWFIREETLRAASTALVNFHHRLPLSSVWGEGTRSSSDGQRFGVQGRSLLATFYPRYFGYYERAVTVYTHTSDQYSVFRTQVISCAPREALYVLDGLLENDSILKPREHHTDTHGYTEHIFGLCYLLGFSFMPRIRDLADQQIYKPGREASFGRLEPLFRGVVDTELIREQYDALVRVAASLRSRTAPAHVIVQRLVRSSPSDRLAKALTQLGRLVKTIYVLRYIHEDDLRRRVQLQLNRGEHRHKLARRLFFANQGEFRRGDYEEIMNKASCLSLLSNAVLIWNTIEIGKIAARLRAQGEAVLDEDVGRLSPLLHAHVIPNGTYHFGRATQGVDIA